MLVRFVQLVLAWLSILGIVGSIIAMIGSLFYGIWHPGDFYPIQVFLTGFLTFFLSFGVLALLIKWVENETE